MKPESKFMGYFILLVVVWFAAATMGGAPVRDKSATDRQVYQVLRLSGVSNDSIESLMRLPRCFDVDIETKDFTKEFLVIQEDLEAISHIVMDQKCVVEVNVYSPRMKKR